MNTLNEQAAALGEILSGAMPDDNVVAHMDALALTAATALKAFEPKVPGGEAQPEVWSQWADFSRRMNEFAQHTAAMAKLGPRAGQGSRARQGDGRAQLQEMPRHLPPGKAGPVAGSVVTASVRAPVILLLVLCCVAGRGAARRGNRRRLRAPTATQRSSRAGTWPRPATA